MIDKVLPGQRVTADTTNKVIDICNGLQTPSESFVNTPNGTLTPVPGYQARYTYSPVPETVLQAKRGPALKMTSRGATRADDQWSQDQKEMTWFCFLGPDTATLTQCLPSSKTPDSIWLGNSNTALFAEVTDSMLSSLRPAGYYADLAAYDEDSVAVKEVKLTKSDDQLDPGKNVLVICGASLDDFGKIQEDSRYSEYDKAEVVNAVLFAKINDKETPFQLPWKTAHAQAVDLVGDSQLSALELSSCVVRELSGKPFIELHEFHEDNTKTVSEVSADGVDVLIRNPNGPNNGRELQYVSLSSLMLSGTYIPPDADVEDAETSSLQTRELDNGTLVEEMFNFHLSDTVDITIDNLSAYDIVVRNPNDGSPYVQYGKLSIDIYPDSEGDSGQKSVAWLTDKHELQLYKFNENGLTSAISTTVDANGNSERLVPDEYEFVFRKGGAGGELQYGKVQLSVHMDELSGDSQTTLGQKSISVENNIAEIYNFHKKDTVLVPLTGISDYDFILRNQRGMQVEYGKLCADEILSSVESYLSGKYIPPDADVPAAEMSSLQTRELSGGAKVEQLFRFDLSDTVELHLSALSGYQFVLRNPNNGKHYVEYGVLCVDTLSGDSQTPSGQKSISVENNVAQLYKFDAPGEPTEQVDLKNAKNSYQDLLPDDEEFVIRSAQGGEIKYKNVGVLLSAYSGGGGGGGDANISVDSELPALQHSSLQHISQGGNDYYELYGFHDSTNTQTSLSGYEYVVRHNDGNGNVSVKYLSADLAAAACPASFDYYTRPDGTHWLRGGYFQQARSFYWVSSTEITASGMIQLSVSMQYNSRSGIIQGASSLPSPTVSAMYIPLWQIGQDMKPTFDYRHAPMLPRWE